MSKFSNFIGTIAPNIAMLLGGPLAGMAVSAIGSALGLTDATKESITKLVESGQLTAEQLSALKQAELAMTAKLKELDIEVEKLNMEDRESARSMQTATKSPVPAILASLVTVGFFGILIGMLRGDLKIVDNSPLLLMLGSLGTSWSMVVSFYFGSSSGSQSKDATIAALRK